jgi:hypothetical protein
VLSPDDSWLLIYEEPSPDVMATRVSSWLDSRGFPQFESLISILPTWSTVVKANEKTLKEFVVNQSKIVNIWCRINDVQLSELWNPNESIATGIKSVLDRIGALDFRELDDALLLKWLVKAGVWPTGMPASLDLSVLGLTEEMLCHQEKTIAEERAAQDKARRSIQFGSLVIDPCGADYDALSKQMQEGLPKSVLRMSLGHMADIHKVEKKSSGGSSGISGGGHFIRLPQEKTALIGFLGECAVYHWLMEQFPKKDIEKTWKSKNRERLYAEKGDDGLGYDFHLEYRRQNWFLEVKASLQNPMTFEMGESEVDKAKECAVSGKGEYMVIYVSNLEEPSKMKILVLPNPFSDEGRKLFGRPKEKFRYSFGV